MNKPVRSLVQDLNTQAIRTGIDLTGGNNTQPDCTQIGLVDGLDVYLSIYLDEEDEWVQ